MIRARSGADQVALHILVQLFLRSFFRVLGEAVRVAVQNPDDELRGLAAEGIFQTQAQAAADILAGSNRAVFHYPFPLHILLAANHDAEGLDFIAALRLPGFKQGFGEGGTGVQGGVSLVLVVGLGNLLAEFRRQLGGEFTPNGKLVGDQVSQAVPDNRFGENPKHRLGFFDRETRAVGGGATCECDMVFDRTGGESPLAVKRQGSITATPFVKDEVAIRFESVNHVPRVRSSARGVARHRMLGILVNEHREFPETPWHILMAFPAVEFVMLEAHAVEKVRVFLGSDLRQVGAAVGVVVLVVGLQESDDLRAGLVLGGGDATLVDRELPHLLVGILKFAGDDLVIDQDFSEREETLIALRPWQRGALIRKFHPGIWPEEDRFVGFGNGFLQLALAPI